MDTRLHLLLLTSLFATLVPAGIAGAAEDPAQPLTQAPQVVEPQVERRELRVPAIDRENFEAGAFGGLLSIEDFGTSAVYGGRFAYHFSEDLFAEARYGMARAGRTSYEDLSGSAELLTDSERDFTYYDVSIGWNALPGEVFFGGERAMPSALYLTLGAGNTSFAGDDHFSVVLGAGFRVLATDWVAGQVEVRDIAFESDLLGKNKLTHNFQFNLGVTAFF
jgi:outer membrane beta-barrel protein